MSKLQPKQRRRPSVSIIGSGRLGAALALALNAAGYSIEALVARRKVRAKRVANLVDGDPLYLAENQLEMLPASELYLIATPDDAIATTARNLALAHSGGAQRQAVLHTSGALSSTVLAPLSKKGFSIGSLHPLLSVSNSAKAAAALRGAFWCLEGDGRATLLGRQIVRDLGGRSFAVGRDRKPLYHAAAVMASGHIVALFDLASELLVRCGLAPNKARAVLVPLLESTTRNLATAKPSRALTGTFARGDLATVRRHLRALATSDSPQALEVYRILGDHALQLAEKNGVEPEILKRMKVALKRGG